MTEKRSIGKKWLLRAVKLLIVAAILWWVEDSISEGWAELNQHDKGQWTWRPAWMVISGGIYLLGLMPFGLFWFHVLRVLGQQARVGETLRAYYIGHLGKYLPGKAMVVVMRAGLIRSHRVDAGVAAASVFLETLTMMASGAFAAGAYLGIFQQGPFAAWSAAAGLLMLIALLPTMPPVFKRLLRLARIGKSNPRAAEKLEKLGYKTLLTGWLMSLLGWVLLGLSYWAALRAMGVAGVDPLGHLPRYVAGVALAVVAGFLLLILPGGLGVREAFLAKLMLPYLETLRHQHANSTAWASAFLLRLVWTVSELIISGIMYFIPQCQSESLESHD